MDKQKFYELLKPLIEIYDSIENSMILDILNRIDNYDGIKGSLKWYLDKLTELKLFEKHNINIVNKNKKEIKKILEDISDYSSKNSISIDTLDSYNKYTNSNLTVKDIYNSESASNLINEALKNTENICNLINTKAIEAGKAEYQNILNTAYLETSTGVYTYNQSIRLAIDKMAKNGILMANYDSGRKISIEAAVRRDVVTRVNQLVGDIELLAAEKMGTNLVYVDQHLGARTRTKYTKEDYEAHDEWQGKVYMIDGSSSKYPNLYEKTGYKEMLGLKGINCYHNLRPYFEWERIPKLIDIEKSRKESEILDKKREFERTIKSLKRERLIAKKLDDKENLQVINKKFNKVNQKYNDWLKENNLTRDYSREYTSQNVKISEEKRFNYEDVTKSWLDNAVPNSHKVKDLHSYKHEGIEYKVDGKNVVLDYSDKEKEVAEWLENTFGGELYMNPRVNNPKGIETSDYLWQGERWDLKTLSEKAISETRAVDNVIKTARTQTDNIILDITQTKLSRNNIVKQVQKIYDTKGRNWLNKIIIIDNYKLIKIYQRKR